MVSDCDHMTLNRARSVFSALNAHGVPFTNAIFNKLETYDEHPYSGRSLAKHCRPLETCSVVDETASAYIEILKEQNKLGNEIAYHGNSQISNDREAFLSGIRNINSLCDLTMTTYIEHGGNPGSHPIEGCKKETLAMEGKNMDSEFYVYDLILENFKQAWCYFDLIDLKKEDNVSLNKRDIFYNKDGMKLMRRARAGDVVNLLRFMKNEDDVCILYTHFGYDGYPTGTLLESWNTPRSVEKNCLFLKRLQKEGFKLQTIQGYLSEQDDKN